MKHRLLFVLAAVVVLGLLAHAPAPAAEGAAPLVAPADVTVTADSPEQDPYLGISPLLEAPSEAEPMSPCILDCFCGGPDGCSGVCGHHANGTLCYCGHGTQKHRCF